MRKTAMVILSFACVLLMIALGTLLFAVRTEPAPGENEICNYIPSPHIYPSYGKYDGCKSTLPQVQIEELSPSDEALLSGSMRLRGTVLQDLHGTFESGDEIEVILTNLPSDLEDFRSLLLSADTCFLYGISEQIDCQYDENGGLTEIYSDYTVNTEGDDLLPIRDERVAWNSSIFDGVVGIEAICDILLDRSDPSYCDRFGDSISSAEQARQDEFLPGETN